MEPVGTLEVLIGLCVFGCIFYSVTHYMQVLAACERLTGRLRRRKPEPMTARPIEDLACDARRLGRRFHSPTPGTRFHKLDALRRSYDDVLGQLCRAIGVEHLLGVLPPGPELDQERRRVEARLTAWGVELEPVDTSGR